MFHSKRKSESCMLLFFYRWGNIEFPLPFGRVMSSTEAFIHGLDEKVNIWTLLL